MTKKVYERIPPTDGSYSACQVAREQKRFMCDAVEHSRRIGCPNPDCWLHRPQERSRT